MPVFDLDCPTTHQLNAVGPAPTNLAAAEEGQDWQQHLVGPASQGRSDCPWVCSCYSLAVVHQAGLPALPHHRLVGMALASYRRPSRGLLATHTAHRIQHLTLRPRGLLEHPQLGMATVTTSLGRDLAQQPARQSQFRAVRLHVTRCGRPPCKGRGMPAPTTHALKPGISLWGGWRPTA
jgi:hypothetical protein